MGVADGGASRSPWDGARRACVYSQRLKRRLVMTRQSFGFLRRKPHNETGCFPPQFARSEGFGSIPSATGGIAGLACARLGEVGREPVGSLWLGLVRRMAAAQAGDGACRAMHVVGERTSFAAATIRVPKVPRAVSAVAECPLKGQTSDTLFLQNCSMVSCKAPSRPRGSLSQRRTCKMMFALFSLAVSAAFSCQFAPLVELRSIPGPAIPAAANRQHDRAYYRRGLRIRLGRASPGIHDFWCATTVRRTPAIGDPGGKRRQHGL